MSLNGEIPEIPEMIYVVIAFDLSDERNPLVYAEQAFRDKEDARKKQVIYAEEMLDEKILQENLSSMKKEYKKERQPKRPRPVPESKMPETFAQAEAQFEWERELDAQMDDAFEKIYGETLREHCEMTIEVHKLPLYD